jgi:hypothetical protein
LARERFDQIDSEYLPTLGGVPALRRQIGSLSAGQSDMSDTSRLWMNILADAFVDGEMSQAEQHLDVVEGWCRS